jgi:cell division protein FtsL
MRIMINIFIIILIALSAFSVVYIKHLNRVAPIELEESEKLLAEQLNNHKKLLDKKTNLINQKLIKENIVNSLDMQIPSKDRIIYLNSVK